MENKYINALVNFVKENDNPKNIFRKINEKNERKNPEINLNEIITRNYSFHQGFSEGIS